MLALKAAYLHAQRGDWRIAVTFNTRSLKDHFRRLIYSFFLEQTGEEPNWDHLRILNAWGAPGGRERDGVYHEFCRANDVEYLDFRTARSRFGQGKEFSGVCEHAIKQVHEPRSVYNVILVDEAQDFAPQFLQLCYKFLDYQKRLVYAYDELQNLSGQSLPSPEELFGRGQDGSPLVHLESRSEDEPVRDVILEKCYRNSRPVLTAAHALGFGIYREPWGDGDVGLIQMFDQSHLWQEIGYRVKDGELAEGSSVTLYRSEDGSPKFLEDHSDVEDLVQFVRFRNENEQAKWLVAAIQKNIKEDELQYEDIVVINPDPRTTRAKVGPIRRRLLEFGINSHLAGVDTDPDIFFQEEENSITFTGVFRAKGNEAGMVYVVHAEDCHGTGRNLARIRNRLFTAMTRSKAWVRVLGIGSGMEALKQEYERLRHHDFELKFVYPTEEQRNHLQIIHRDMTTSEDNRLNRQRREMIDLIERVKSGEAYIEDLGEEVVDELRELLKLAR